MCDRTDSGKACLTWRSTFLVRKKQLGQIIDRCIRKSTVPRSTSEILDNIKAQGFKYSTKGAITVAVCDALIPPQKKQELLARGRRED